MCARRPLARQPDPPVEPAVAWRTGKGCARSLFASEMMGAVRGIDPSTGHHYDDTRRHIDNAGLDDEARAKIFEGNARRVYPRLEVQQ